MDLYIAAYRRVLQVDALERDALEVLRLIRSVKNSFAPINQIPPEVISIIPDYYGEDGDRVLVTLTHVCHGWRDIFVSRSSLWTRLHFTNVDKTRNWIERSQSSPLKLYLGPCKPIHGAFKLVMPHINRLGSLTINARALPSVLEHFHCRTPLLEKLDISSTGDPVLDDALFDGDLSSLRELRLHKIITHFPWKNLANLRVVDLKPHSHRYKTTQILDFFESAPFLHTVLLQFPMPCSFDAPPKRVVRLHHLKLLTINAPPPHSTLLHHLHIPIGASLISEFCFSGNEPPIPDYLPERSHNFDNLSHITAINFLFYSQQKFLQFGGPSGNLRVLATWKHIQDPPSYTIDRQILHSLGHPLLSTIKTLVVSKYKHARQGEVEECPILQTLSSTNDLRILTLINCNNLPFILALNPEQNPSNLVLCPKMEDLVIYVQYLSLFDVELLVRAVRNRALRGVKLSSIKLVGLRGDGEREEVTKLREHVARVEYRAGGTAPAWDHTPGQGGGGSE